jgi:hypothetical protein
MSPINHINQFDFVTRTSIDSLGSGRKSPEIENKRAFSNSKIPSLLENMGRKMSKISINTGGDHLPIIKFDK